MYKPNKIIIVGGNAAGPAAAAKAKRTNPDAEVILYEAGEFISTGTCELPYLISGEISDYKNILFFSPESFYEKKGVKVYNKHRVEKIDRRAKKITVLDKISGRVFEDSYDKLILATGSTAKELAGLSIQLNNVFSLKSVADFIQIKSFMESNSVSQVLIIGSGYIGLESAEAFVNIGKSVTIVDLANAPMPNAEPEIQQKISEILNKNNVEFISICQPDYITENETIKYVKIDGRLIEFDLILIAAGVVPNNQLAASAGLEIGKFNGLKVDRKMRTSDPNIFAAGDNVELTNKITRRPGYFPLATLAHQNGHVAGCNAAGGNIFAEEILSNVAVKIFNSYYVSVGLVTKELKKMRLDYTTVNAEVPNLVKVMPNSRKVFGKVVIDKYNKFVLGASFIGGREVSGYADVIASLIHNKSDVRTLAKINFNYTPPLSPFVNLLSVLGRKAEEKL